MLTCEAAAQRTRDLVEQALKAGADAADAAYSGSSSETVEVRLGKLEDVERSEGEHVTLRVFCGARSASIGSSDLGDAALAELASRAVDMARAAPEDPFAGLAESGLLAVPPFPDLDLRDEHEVSPQVLRRLAEEAEEAARAVNGVTNSEGGSASAGTSVAALATSEGFVGAYSGSSHALSASVIAGTGTGMQRDYASRQVRHFGDLPGPEEIGTLAGERAVARLDSGRVKSGRMPVVFDPRVGGSLLGHLVGAMSGTAIARGASFLLGRLEQDLFDASVVIREDPLRARGLRSRPFDGEGLATASRNLVEKGRLSGWLLNLASARQLGLPPTGHASRGGGAPGVTVANLTLEPGAVTPSALMGDIANGIYVTHLFGNGVNQVTGDYSVGAAGFRIESGERTGSVAEFTIAGNLVDMFAAMIPADDLELYRGIDVPTIRIDGMSVAGD